MTKYRIEYVVVVNPGEINESEVISYPTLAQACAYLDAIPAGGPAYDIMKRLETGDLTTEY
jgi:hypothetical protein